jgi:hypothetical protein
MEDPSVLRKGAFTLSEHNYYLREEPQLLFCLQQVPIRPQV